MVTQVMEELLQAMKEAIANKENIATGSWTKDVYDLSLAYVTLKYSTDNDEN